MNQLDPEYYRVFAFGPGHGMQISERLSKSDADKRRRDWLKLMPQSDVRIEKVNAQGWPVSHSSRTTKVGTQRTERR